MLTSDSPSAQSLLERIHHGDAAAMRELYTRHAGLVFSIAARIVSKEEAEDIVQELFFLLWQKPESFDASRGSFSGWLAQTAKNRALNEKRRHQNSRREANSLDGKIGIDVADLAKTSDGATVRGIHSGAPGEPADPNPPADEALWAEHRREVLKRALNMLPHAQQRAVSLAFFEELPHSEVASVLGAPVGTVKTRIRLGLKRLSALVAAAVALALVTGALLGMLFFAWRQQQKRAQVERALRMVTASDVAPLHLSAAPGIPRKAHGSYRARPPALGIGVAILATSDLPALADGERYVGWARAGNSWSSFGALVAIDEGRTLTVGEGASFALAPDELRVTRESLDSSATQAPSGPTVISWQRLP